MNATMTLFQITTDWYTVIWFWKLRNQFSDFKTELNLNVINFKGELITKINNQNDKIDKLVVVDVNKPIGKT